MASEEYQWGFALVAAWSSHLDPADGALWDISPGNIGNAPELPQTLAEYQEFYNMLEGGDASRGHSLNPHTGQPYEEQWVPRADYARVLAEFWADGPETETPPGHWFSILNYVSDHPLFEKRFKGEGPILDDLEWDVKAYLAMGGAMHDAAVTTWSIKCWYDYVRPISAIRWLADQGQSSDPDLPHYDLLGLPLIDGHIELVQAGDPLAGEDGEHIGKIKLKSWRGPTYIADPATDIAGVGWILAENWWPYQRSNFVTPAFAGYVSGHSTFSSAAAEILTLLTGDPFFPGGLGEFRIERNRFLVFEEGPSIDVVLQWATYQDASDQSSLSRLWGGIHPPADDVPARLIGSRIGEDAFALAEAYFSSPTQGAARRSAALVENSAAELPMEFALEQNYPNPFNNGTAITFDLPYGDTVDLTVYTISGQKVATLVRGTRAAGYHQVLWDGDGTRTGGRASQRRLPIPPASWQPAKNAENATAALSSGLPPVPIRWLLVKEPNGQFPPQALLSTDQTITPQQMLTFFIQRWTVETTFEEARAHLGMETQRQWNDQAIARSTPLVLALFALVALWAHTLRSVFKTVFLLGFDVGVLTEHLQVSTKNRVKGRKRHVLVDSQGSILQCKVTAANISDADGLKALLSAYFLPGVQRLKRVWVDAAIEGRRSTHGSVHRLHVSTLSRWGKPKSTIFLHLHDKTVTTRTAPAFRFRGERTTAHSPT